MANNIFLTDNEKQAIKVLNFVATHDGIIDNEDEIKFLLQQGIEKFIAKRRQHLVSITETAYPIRIKVLPKKKPVNIVPEFRSQDYITEMPITGICTVDAPLVIKQWDDLWWIAQWDEQYRLVHHTEKNSPNTNIKLTISTEQAQEIIDAVGLTPVNGGFASATNWKLNH